MSGAEAVLPRLGAIVARVVGPSRMPASVDANTRLAADLWLDSIELLNVVLGCEAEFGVTFDEGCDFTPEALESLGSLAAVIAARCQPR